LSQENQLGPIPKSAAMTCAAPRGTMGLYQDPGGEIFYFTKERVFVLRRTDDVMGYVPCWAFVCHRQDI